MKALFDTDILIDYIHGVVQAKNEIDRFSENAISPINWMEVMVGVTPENDYKIRGFLKKFIHLPVNESVAETAVTLRKRHKIKLSDAIIWATAQESGRILITRNTKDFADDDPSIRVPYQL